MSDALAPPRLTMLPFHMPMGVSALPDARSSALWREVERALARIDAGVSAGRGDHVRIAFRGRRAVLARPPGIARACSVEIAAIERFLRGERLKAHSDRQLVIGDYAACVIFDEGAERFCAQALDINDIIMARGRNTSEMREAFAAAVDDYHWFCKARGEYAEAPRHPALSSGRAVAAL